MLRGKRQQSNVAGLLDGAGQTALMRGANAGETPRNNFAALGHELLQQPDIAVRNRVDLIGAELADLLAAEELAAAAGPTAGPRPAPRGPEPGPDELVELRARPKSRTILLGFLQASCFLFSFPFPAGAWCARGRLDWCRRR